MCIILPSHPAVAREHSFVLLFLLSAAARDVDAPLSSQPASSLTRLMTMPRRPHFYYLAFVLAVSGKNLTKCLLPPPPACSAATYICIRHHHAATINMNSLLFRSAACIAAAAARRRDALPHGRGLLPLRGPARPEQLCASERASNTAVPGCPRSVASDLTCYGPRPPCPAPRVSVPCALAHTCPRAADPNAESERSSSNGASTGSLFTRRHPPPPSLIPSHPQSTLPWATFRWAAGGASPRGPLRRSRT